MNKNILNEVKRNRELMGINESELDEQGFFERSKGRNQERLPKG